MTTAITIVGNLTRAPEIRFTASGTAVATVGVAVERRRRKPDGSWESETEFFDVTAWKDLAEQLASLEQGTRIIATGRLSARSWETKAGEKRTSVEVVADDIGASIRFAEVTVKRTVRRGGEA